MSESDTMFNKRDRRCAAVQLMLSTDPSYDNRTIANCLKMQNMSFSLGRQFYRFTLSLTIYIYIYIDPVVRTEFKYCFKKRVHGIKNVYDFKTFLIPCTRFEKQYLNTYIYIYIYKG